MKIAFTTEYSYPSKCGVWNTVYNLAKELQKKGHEIHVFSSSIIKGTKNKSPKLETIDGITYHRFPVLFQIGENGQFWKFKKELKKLKPEIIHSHSFRHFHSNKTPKIARKLKIPCYLTTHAPFLERNIRKPIVDFLVNSFDLLVGKIILNSYTKVLAISKWEIPFLLTLGCKKSKIEFIPNGIPKEFLKIKPKHNKKVIFMGRISPVKNIENILKVAKNLPNITFTIYGPIEKGYKLTSDLKNVNIINKPYTKKEEINQYQKHSIFILPSKTESIPLALLEAMASGLVCISSDTRGGLEVIKHNKDGFIYEKNNTKQLEKLITKITKDKKVWNKISKQAKESTKNRTWEKIANKLDKIYKTNL